MSESWTGFRQTECLARLLCALGAILVALGLCGCTTSRSALRWAGISTGPEYQPRNIFRPMSQLPKALLQTRITTTSKSFSTRRQPPASGEPEAESELRKLVRELLALERENQAALQAQQRRTRQQQAEFTQTSRTLRQVHAAYAPGGRAGWHSYS